LVNVYNADLSKDYKKNVLALIDVVKNSECKEDLIFNPVIEETVLYLAKVTLRQDFINMFCKLNDFSKSNNFDFIESSFAEEVKTGFDDMYESHFEIENRRAKGLPDCNCNWTCGDHLSQYATDKCNETDSGCGFLWMSPCRKKDVFIE